MTIPSPRKPVLFLVYVIMAVPCFIAFFIALFLLTVFNLIEMTVDRVSFRRRA